MNRHAIFEDFRVVWINQDNKLQGKLVGFVPTHISQLWQIGQENGITHFWIMPDSCVDQFGYDFFSKMEGYNIFVPLLDSPSVPTSPRSGRCWKENSGGGTHQICVLFPFRTPWDWDVRKGPDILAALHYLHQVLPSDMEIEWSPQAMGEKHLRKLYSGTNRLQAYIQDSTEDLEILPFKRADKDVVWRGELTEEMEGQFLHVYDKNSAHPSAAASMVTGYGEPIHLIDTESTEPIEPRYPGIYRVYADCMTSRFNGKLLPRIIENEWCTLPVLRFALKQNCNVHIREAYLFTQHRVIFDQWARDLWQARIELRGTQFIHNQARGNAQQCIKDIMNHTISTLRLNWYADMVGMARTCLLANIAKFATAGYYPSMIYYDGLGYVSPIPSPTLAIPTILDRQDKLGGYKHLYSLVITRQMIKDCRNVRAGGMWSYMKALARERGLI